MSEGADAFCSDLRDHLNVVGERLDRAKARVKSAAAVEEADYATLDAISSRLIADEAAACN